MHLWVKLSSNSLRDLDTFQGKISDHTLCDNDGDTVWHYLSRLNETWTGLTLRDKLKLSPKIFSREMFRLNDLGLAPIHIALEKASQDLIPAALLGADGMVPLTPGGQSILHQAIHIAFNWVLVDNGFRTGPAAFQCIMECIPDAKDADENTSKIINVLGRDCNEMTVIDILLEMLTDKDTRPGPTLALLLPKLTTFDLQAYRYQSRSLLSWAAQFGLAPVCKYLLDHGADIDEAELVPWLSSEKSTPLEVLVFKQGPYEILEAALSLSKRRYSTLLHLALRGFGPTRFPEPEFEERALVLLVNHGCKIEEVSQDSARVPLLSLAASLGNMRAVEFLLTQGANVDATDASGKSAIHAAAIEGHISVLKLLLHHSSSMGLVMHHMKPFWGGGSVLLGPLELAAVHGHSNVVRVLWSHREKYARSPELSALWCACISGNYHSVRDLIGHSQSLDALHPVTGMSLLHAAAASGHPFAIFQLLDANHPFKLLDFYGRPPSFYVMNGTEMGYFCWKRLKDWEAIRQDKSKICQFSRAERSLRSMPISTHAANTLYRAIDNDDWRAINSLQNSVPHLNIPFSCGICSPLLVAMSKGKVTVCRFLLDAGASLNARACKGHGGLTPYHCAAATPAMSTILASLLEHAQVPQYYLTASPNADPANSLLHQAAITGNISGLEILLKHGANIECLDLGWRTPLCIAAGQGHVVFVHRLLQLGCSVNIRDRSLETPLMHAARADRSDVVQLLKRARADLLLRNTDGKMAVDLAKGNTRLMLDFRFGLERPLYDSTRYLPSAHTSSLLLGQGPRFVYTLHSDHELDDVHAFTCWNSVSSLHRVLRRYSRSRLRLDANSRQTLIRGYTPLGCVAKLSLYVFLETLAAAGALINLEGGPEGTPLMIACTYGRLSVVKALIRMGALECYVKGEKLLSALGAARRHPQVLHWLLVVRHTEQKKVTHVRLGKTDDTTSHIDGSEFNKNKPWSTFDRTLVLTEDWPAYSQKLFPPSRRFICRMTQGQSTIELSPDKEPPHYGGGTPPPQAQYNEQSPQGQHGLLDRDFNAGNSGQKDNAPSPPRWTIWKNHL
jgi:ankyrin repeat protein